MKKYKIIILIIFSLSFTLMAQEENNRPSPSFTPVSPDTLLEENYIFRTKPNIAVIPFTNTNTQAKETEYGRTVSAMLATALRSQTNFIVLERSELNKILSEQTLGLSGLTQEMAQTLGELYNVEVVLGGDVSLIDHTLHIDARLIETNSSKIVVALYATCQDLKLIRNVVDNLAKELEQTYLRQWMGSISINSQPAGTEVYLDGKYIGLTNDQQTLEISELLEGTYNLKLIRGGYDDWESEIIVLSKMERSVKISLIAKPGAMNIYSSPEGAKIYVDNNFMGETPQSLKKVAEGEHEIRLVKENYKEWTQNVTVRSFQPTDVKATLKVSPGILTVNSKPTDANVYFKGQFIAKTSHILSNIPPGEIVIRVEKDGYEEWTTSVMIQPNKHEVLDIVLKEKVGTLNITSRPEDVEVYIRNAQGLERKKIGDTPILNFTTSIGNYVIDVEKKDYFSSRKTVSVMHKQLSSVSFELKEKPGSIFVETNPSKARIFLDGTFKGRSPLHIDNIPKGEYQINMGLPYDQEEKMITVETNRQTTVSASFSKPEDYMISMTSIGMVAILFHLLAK